MNMANKEAKNVFGHPAVIITILILVFLAGYFFLTRNQNNGAQAPQQNTPSQQDEINSLRKELDILKSKEANDTNSTSAQNSNISSIVSEYRNRTAFLLCSGTNPYSGQTYSQTGTGYVYWFDHATTLGLLTNKHVVTDDYGNAVTGCEVIIPGDQNSIFVSSADMKLHPDPTIDAARINIANPDAYLSSFAKKKVCDVKINTGDQVVILGYPAIGSPTDITATEGIISGKDYPYYVSSAKIDHGNSGGLAILVKNDCYFGIPSGAAVGSIESLGRILDVNAIAK